MQTRHWCFCSLKWILNIQINKRYKHSYCSPWPMFPCQWVYKEYIHSSTVAASILNYPVVSVFRLHLLVLAGEVNVQNNKNNSFYVFLKYIFNEHQQWELHIHDKYKKAEAATWTSTHLVHLKQNRIKRPTARLNEIMLFIEDVRPLHVLFHLKWFPVCCTSCATKTWGLTTSVWGVANTEVMWLFGKILHYDTWLVGMRSFAQFHNFTFSPDIW